MFQHAHDFAFDYVPPVRKRARGSRSLGEQVVCEVVAKPQKAARQHSDGGAKSVPIVDQEAKVKPNALPKPEPVEIEVPEGMELSDEQEAMLRILQELFSPKHYSFSKPFVDEDEAKREGISQTLLDVRTRFSSGELLHMSEFAADVRNTFALCYMKFGHPYHSAVAKRCSRLDEVFEQNVTLLPRSMRDGAMAVARVLRQHNSPQPGGGADDDWKRRSSRTKLGVVQQTTLQLVEQVNNASPLAPQHFEQLSPHVALGGQNKERLMMQQEQEKQRLAREYREGCLASPAAPLHILPFYSSAFTPPHACPPFLPTIISHLLLSLYSSHPLPSPPVSSDTVSALFLSLPSTPPSLYS